MLAVFFGKQVTEPSNRLRLAEKQNAVVEQRIMKYLHDPLLQFGFEVDQQVPAAHHVEADKRRVLDQVLSREQRHVAQTLVDAVHPVLGGEISRNQCAVEFTQCGFRVNAGPCRCHRIVVDIGGKQLDPVLVPVLAEFFGENDGDGIDFLACGTTRNPDPDIVSRLLVFQHFTQATPYRLKRIGVAKERGDTDQEVACQFAQLLAILRDVFTVGIERGNLHRGHAPQYLPRNGCVLVIREIHAGMCGDLANDAADGGWWRLIDLVGDRGAGPLHNRDQLVGNFMWRQDQVGTARTNGRVRHAVVLG